MARSEHSFFGHCDGEITIPEAYSVSYDYFSGSLIGRFLHHTDHEKNALQTVRNVTNIIIYKKRESRTIGYYRINQFQNNSWSIRRKMDLIADEYRPSARLGDAVFSPLMFISLMQGKVSPGLPSTKRRRWRHNSHGSNLSASQEKLRTVTWKAWPLVGVYKDDYGWQLQEGRFK